MHFSKSTLLIGGLFVTTFLAGLILTSPNTSADNPSEFNLSVNVPAACSLIITDRDLSQTISPGVAISLIGTSHLKAVCNDGEGLSIYAVGYTGNTYGDNSLRLAGTENYIPTSIVEDTNSRWNMKVANDTEVPNNLAATISDGTNDTENFTTNHIIPTTYTKIASYPSTTDQTIGTNINTEFYGYVAPSQPAGTYTGKVKFALVHPMGGIRPNDYVYFTKDIQVSLKNYSGNYDIATADFHGDCANEHIFGPVVIKTPNIAEDGTENRGLALSDLKNFGNGEEYMYIYEKAIPLPAGQYKVVVHYDFEINEANPMTTQCDQEGCEYETHENAMIQIGDSYTNSTVELYGEGTRELFFGDSVSQQPLLLMVALGIRGDKTINTAHDYGVYVEIYQLDGNGEIIEEWQTTMTRCEWTATGEGYEVYYNYMPWSTEPNLQDWYEVYMIENILDNINEPEVTLYSWYE
ncbi:hypothetical protein IK146_01805 [Candidatus Saccharibacteria bacterium]|nr:hypothetical protein [Candidatus Saccharibacteria bacterium]